MPEIIECEQLSDEWNKARLGSIGGSSISSVVAGGQGKMRKSLMYRLAGEILSGEKYEGYRNADMDRGLEQEAEARSMYEFMTGNEVKQVGLVKIDDHKHYSPDGLIDPEGINEIKCQIPSVHIECVVNDKIDGSYMKQMQWGLYVCERQWCDFTSYSPLIIDKPIWIKRIERDEKLIKQLDEGADRFLEELATLIRKFKER